MSGYVISKRGSDFALYVGEFFPDVSCQRVPNNAHMGIIISFGANGHVQTYHLQRLVIDRHKADIYGMMDYLDKTFVE
jgi:hypothetical protein